ncbi:MAG TPA: peptidoglycan DD-metalloendopeptidase family protein [candidate division Zixibacteria bacterium]|nr:peptidoglycan DD-metalloendopeptidase family protein [candidate division Zixibacteria bacterium]
MRYIVFTALAFSLCLAVTVQSADKQKENILNQQQELQKIKSEVEASKAKLDSLKENEVGIQKQISETDQRISSNKKVITRLGKELRGIQGKIKMTQEDFDNQQLQLDLSRRRYLGNIRQFYLAAHEAGHGIAESPDEELNLNRKVVYLTALAHFESGRILHASEFLAQTLDKRDQLYGESKKMTSLKRSKETATALAATQKEQQEKNLEQIRRRKTQEADRMVTLEQAARDMEEIITRLQKEAEQRRIARHEENKGPSAFAALRGQLISPYRGKIIQTFGDQVDKVTNLRSFSSGITIKGKPGTPVKAVASGTIAYVGNLRGYGNFIIINHDDQYYTTYAGMVQPKVKTSEYVLTGTTLGLSGDDGMVRFELRQGRNPLDPVEWIRLDSF